MRAKGAKIGAKFWDFVYVNYIQGRSQTFGLGEQREGNRKFFNFEKTLIKYLKNFNKIFLKNF